MTARTRGEAVLRALSEQPGAARRLGADEVGALLRPWLGDAAVGGWRCPE